jgi:hypothetical protein
MDEGGIEALAGVGRVVALDLRNQGADSFFLFDSPAGVGVGCALELGLPFDKKRNTIADLSQCRVCTKIPNGCGQDVFSGSKEAGNVVGFIAPMRQIAATRARAYTFSIHIENELIVRAHVHRETSRRSS